MRRAKIVATLGPASHEEKMIEELAKAGADVFRINMSHASHEVLNTTVERIRNVEKRLNHPLGILVDLQGPKLRVWKFADGAVELAAGQKFTLDSDDTPGTTESVYLPHPEIIESVSVGDRLLLDDGKLQLKATKVGNGAIETEVVYGGKLSDKKGVSLPDTLLPTGALTEKDHADLVAGLAADADWIALSFVQRPEDIIDVRKIVQGRAGVMAKIEKPQAIERLEEIIKLCDAIMVARGDLGVELPLEQVPGLQKRMIRMAREKNKLAITATQMMESMISSPIPTRAEVSDVANAVIDGTDAVMLSAETAAGLYPVEAVAAMDRVCIEAEKEYETGFSKRRLNMQFDRVDESIAMAAMYTAYHLQVKAIVALTESGSTALWMSRVNPDAPIYALTPDVATRRKLTLFRGVYPVNFKPATQEREQVLHEAEEELRRRSAVMDGDLIVLTIGEPIGKSGGTNTMKIVKVGESRKTNG